MRWYRPLYLSKNTADQIDKIREKAAAGAWVPGIYFVTLSSEPGHLLDLFHNTMLKESIFRDVQRLDIVGVAQGRMEACLVYTSPSPLDRLLSRIRSDA